MTSGLVKVLIGAIVLVSLQIPLASASQDPFPGVAHGSEIPGSRITSDPGLSQSAWEATATYQAFSCPEGSGRGIGIDISSRQWFAYCVKQWQPQQTIDAWASYRKSVEDAKAIALAESQAWNAANPGKQKCVQWGPLRDPTGGESSGGVCANPVEPGPGATVPTQDAPTVNASSETSTASVLPSTNPTPNAVSNSNLFVEDTTYRGSGYPFTRIYRGQLSTLDCPIGYQGANGLIAAIGIGTFTECWPENAWTAHRIGGEIWESFRASGGTYDVMTEVRRRENVEALKRESKRVAQIAADQTPGVQRCSRWNGYGESGTECAYAFKTPTAISSSNGETTTTLIDSRTAVVVPDSPTVRSETETTSIATNLVNETATVTLIEIEGAVTETSSVRVVTTSSDPILPEEEYVQTSWLFSRPELVLRPV